MRVYVTVTRPVELDQEISLENAVHEWFDEVKHKLNCTGVYPYDPVLRELSIELGDQQHQEMAVGDLQSWLDRCKAIKDIEVIVTCCSALETMSRNERIEHLRHKMLYLLSSTKKINRELRSNRLRQIEYLMSSIATELAELLPVATAEKIPPEQEKAFFKKIEDFWEGL